VCEIGHWQSIEQSILLDVVVVVIYSRTLQIDHAIRLHFHHSRGLDDAAIRRHEPRLSQQSALAHMCAWNY